MCLGGIGPCSRLGQMCDEDHGGALGKLIFICFTVCLGLAQPITDPVLGSVLRQSLLKCVCTGRGGTSDWIGNHDHGSYFWLCTVSYLGKVGGLSLLQRFCLWAVGGTKGPSVCGLDTG